MNARALTPVVLTVSWLLSLAVVFGLGVFLSLAVNTQPRNQDLSAVHAPLEQRQVLLTVERLTGQGMNASEWSQLIQGSEAEAFLAGLVRLLIATRDAAEREFHTRSLSAALPLSMQGQVLRIALMQPQSPQRDHVLAAMLHRWGVLDGRSAVTFVRNQPLSSDLEPLLLAAIRGWSSVAYRDAWSWLEQQTREDRVQALRRGEALRTLAQQDPSIAFSLLLELQEHSYFALMTRSFFGALLETNPPATAALWMNELPRGPAYATAAAVIANVWAGVSLTDSLSWVRSLDFQWQSALLQQLAVLWAEQDPTAAILWASAELEHGLLLDAFVQKAGFIWLEDEGPAAIAKWLNEHPASPAYDSLAAILVQYTSFLEPATALVWAESIRQSAKRDFWTAQVQSSSGLVPVRLAEPAQVLSPIEEAGADEEDFADEIFPDEPVLFDEFDLEDEPAL